jgi:putative salt-induced outer membrane protein YdiY
MSFPTTCAWRFLPFALCFTLTLAAPGLLSAQDTGGEAGIDWQNTSELSYLLTGGNSSANTLGLRNALRGRSVTGELRFDVSVRRTETTRVTRTAVGGSRDDFEVSEDRESERTAERYAVDGRYDRNLSEHFFAFAGLGWERNEFAGFNHRTVAVTGAGNQWTGREGDWELKVGYGVTYTVRRDVVPDPSRDNSFAGLRLTLDHAHQLTESTDLELKWIADGNLQETSELRGDLTQGISTALSDRLALKTTLQLLLNNDPPLESLPLVTPDGSPLDEQVRVPLGKMDHTISVALVITM